MARLNKEGEPDSLNINPDDSSIPDGEQNAGSFAQLTGLEGTPELHFPDFPISLQSHHDTVDGGFIPKQEPKTILNDSITYTQKSFT